MIKLTEILTNGGEFITRKGNTIRRFKGQVGKAIGGQLYVHKNYAAEVIPTKVIEYAEKLLQRFDPQFQYNCIMLDLNRDEIRFDEAPDFDTAREPHVGKFVKIDLKGAKPPYEEYSDSIWHHKWLWVRDDYSGFDIDDAKEWSRMWLSKLREPAKSTNMTWNMQLRKHGLTEGRSKRNYFGLGQLGPYDEVDFKWIPSIEYHGAEHSGRFSYQTQRRFRFHFSGEGTDSGMVYWGATKPSDEDMDRVEEFFRKQGIEVTQRDWQLNLLREQLLMEVTLEEASLEFLKKMVQGGPFRERVYLAGGAVRDMELGKKPKDLDVSVVGDGLRGGLNFTIWLAKQMGNYKGPSTPPPTFPKHIAIDDYGRPETKVDERGNSLPPTTSEEKRQESAAKVYDDYYASFSNPVIFPKFGTAKVNLIGVHNGIQLDGMQIEAVAARKEVYTEGSRKPKVYPGTLEDDVFRRDFCANSLMLDLTTNQILDLTGKGRADIKAGILRTPLDPAVTFKDDPLRMMRAIRFMVQKGWQIDPATEQGIKEKADWITTISSERVQDELRKMLVTGNPDAAIRKLQELGILRHILPEIDRLKGLVQNKYHNKDAFEHTLDVLRRTNPDEEERLMGLFHDIGKFATRSETPDGVHFFGHEDVGSKEVEIRMRALKYPLELIRAVVMGVKEHMYFKQYGDDPVKLSDKSLRKFAMRVGKDVEKVLNLIHADNLSHAPGSELPNQIAAIRQHLGKLEIKSEQPTLPINGDDILAMGVPRGKKIGQILSAVTEAWFENPNISREEAIAIVRRMI